MKSARSRDDDGGFPPRPRVATSVLALLAVLLLAVGAAAGFLLSRPPVPPTMVSSTQPRQVAVSISPFDDERNVTLRVTSSASQTVTTTASGTVTASSCAPNAVIRSGSVPISVDLMPKMALSTSVPPFRAMALNARGDDAAAFNAELRRLGYPAPQGDAITWDTIVAYNELAHDLGAPALTAASGWSIDPAALIWLPAPAVAVSQCLARVGQNVASGQELFSTKPSVIAAAIQHDGEAAEGDRIVTIGTGQFTLAAKSTQITDAKMLAAIAASPQFAESSASGMPANQQSQGSDAQHATSGSAPSVTAGASPDETSVDVTYTWRLAKPVSTMSVPPSALYDVTERTACVTVSGKPAAVTIVASQLGRSMVSAQDGSTFRTVDVPARGSASCHVQ